MSEVSFPAAVEAAPYSPPAGGPVGGVAFPDAYYEARSLYFSRQEALHGAGVRRMQRLGRRRNMFRREARGAAKIQRLWRSIKARRSLEVALLYAEKHMRESSAAAVLQRNFRGRSGRRAAAARLVAFVAEAQRNEVRRLAASLVQAVARGVGARELLRTVLRGARDARAARAEANREARALAIQCCYRQRVGRDAARLRRRLRRNEVEAGEKDRELEAALDGLKVDQERTLFAMRLQCCARKRRARKRLQTQLAAVVGEERGREEKRLGNAAAKVQCLARGVRGRRQFAAERPKLVESKVIRGALQAMRLRQQAEVHKIEARMRHLEKFGPSEYLWSGVRGELGAAAEADSEALVAGDAATPWAQQWDDEAGALYWYNSETGEASWTDPSYVWANDDAGYEGSYGETGYGEVGYGEAGY